MDSKINQDEAFEKYWAENAKRFRQAHNCDGAEETLKDVAREVWYGSLNAQPDWDGVQLVRPLSSRNLLAIIAERGGALKALAEAGMIALKKGEDYNNTGKAPGEERDVYFPLGLPSYAQMIHVKATRLVSFAAAPRDAKHESVRDTALDIINYASFLADWLERQIKGRA